MKYYMNNKTVDHKIMQQMGAIIQSSRLWVGYAYGHPDIMLKESDISWYTCRVQGLCGEFETACYITYIYLEAQILGFRHDFEIPCPKVTRCVTFYFILLSQELVCNLCIFLYDSAM
jgi:hypothetical protein